MDKNPLQAFTLAARFLIVAGIFLAAGGTWAYIDWAYEGLPGGSYPVFFFAAPVLLVAGAFVGAGLLLFRRLGVPILRDTPAPPSAGQVPEESGSDQQVG